MIQRSNISYIGMEQAVVAHQEAQGKKTLLNLRGGDKAAVAPDVFHVVKSHDSSGGTTHLMTPSESRIVVNKLKHQGLLDAKNHVVSMVGIDGILSAVRVGSGKKALSPGQQDHVRMVLRFIRNGYGVRRGGEGLLQKVDRLAGELEELNRRAKRLL